MAAAATITEYALQIARAGTAAALAIALGTSPTAANATGLFSDLTATAERVSLVVGGIAGAQFRRSGSDVQIVAQNGTRDGIALVPRGGGSSSWVASVTSAALTGNRTWTLADRSDTFAGLAAQTFTGAQTFNAGLTSTTVSVTSTADESITTAGGVRINRASSAAFGEYRVATAGTTNWTFGLRGGDSSFHMTETALAADWLTVAAGASGAITTPRPLFAGAGNFTATGVDTAVNATSASGQNSGRFTDNTNTTLTIGHAAGQLRISTGSTLQAMVFRLGTTEYGRFTATSGELTLVAAASVGTNLLLSNGVAAYDASRTVPTLYSTSGGGSGFFSEAGNLYISPRVSGAARDVAISLTGTTEDILIGRNSKTLLQLSRGTVTSASALVLDSSVTWNAAATFVAWKLDVTDTSSNSGSLLQSMSVGGVSRLALQKNGLLTTTLWTTVTATTDLAHLIRCNSTGTPAAFFGSTIRWQLQSSTTADQNAAQIDLYWTTATHASRAAQMDFQVYDAAGARKGLSIAASGSAPLIAFLGASPVARATMAAATGTATRTTFDTATVTTEQLAQRVKAMIDDSRAYGLHG